MEKNISAYMSISAIPVSLPPFIIFLLDSASDLVRKIFKNNNILLLVTYFKVFKNI